jgi:membrane protein involved in colicin uptake
MEKQYAELVAQAENAVAQVKDPELRRVAFEKILDDLLTAGEPGNATGTKPVQNARASSTGKRTSGNGVGATRSGPKGHIEELVDEKFFNKPKTISEVQVELANRGHHIPQTSLSGPLQNLCKQKVLRRQKVDGSFQYSNW